MGFQYESQICMYQYMCDLETMQLVHLEGIFRSVIRWLVVLENEGML